MARLQGPLSAADAPCRFACAGLRRIAHELRLPLTLAPSTAAGNGTYVRVPRDGGPYYVVTDEACALLLVV